MRDEDGEVVGTGAAAPSAVTKPLHMQVREALVARLVAGEYPVGSLLPTEMDLAREFDTSRFTIREAMRHLQAQGYVARRQGVGTRVISAAPQGRYGMTVASLDELFRVGTEARLDVRAEQKVVLDDRLARLVDGREGEVWLRVEGLRRAPDAGFPLIGVQAYFPEAMAPMLPYLRSRPGPWFTLLEEAGAGTIERTVQEISARPLPGHLAEWMTRTPGDTALRLVRRYSTRDGVVLAAVNWHPDEEMTFVMEVQRTDLQA
ncbi:MAG: GntR family transcriptional regulator [Alkalilacustris sp.]